MCLRWIGLRDQTYIYCHSSFSRSRVWVEGLCRLSAWLLTSDMAYRLVYRLYLYNSCLCELLLCVQFSDPFSRIHGKCSSDIVDLFRTCFQEV